VAKGETTSHMLLPTKHVGISRDGSYIYTGVITGKKGKINGGK